MNDQSDGDDIELRYERSDGYRVIPAHGIDVRRTPHDDFLLEFFFDRSYEIQSQNYSQSGIVKSMEFSSNLTRELQIGVNLDSDEAFHAGISLVEKFLDASEGEIQDVLLEEFGMDDE